MDTVSLMASDAQYNEQGETIDDWLVGSEFEAVNQIPDPSAIQISRSGPTSGIGIFDPEHLLSADLFPDFTDFSPRGVDDRPRRDKEKGSPVQDGAVPPELISIGKGACVGVPSMHIEPVSNGSISLAPVPTQGLRNDPDSNNGLETHAAGNQFSRAGSAANREHLIDSYSAPQGGAGPAAVHGLRIDSAAHPLHTEHAADCSRSIQDLTSRLALSAPDSQQELFTERSGHNPARKKRERDKVNAKAQKQATDMAQELARVASLPPNLSKRRKGGRATSNTATAKVGTEAREASGNGSGSAIAKGSSSKRPPPTRARPGSMAANITHEEKRRIRAERNRVSAEKSRLRQKQNNLELEQNVLRLRTENRELKARVDTFRIQLQSASQNLANGKGNFAGDGVLATQVPALKSAIAAIEQVMQECPRTFGPESNIPEIALNVKTTR